MRHRIAGWLPWLLVLLVADAPCPAAPLKKLSAEGVTVEYPPGLEAQARQVLQAAAQAAPGQKEQYLKARRALGDKERLVRRIAELLGCTEKTEMLRAALSVFDQSFDAGLAMLTHLRLYHEAEVRRSGGIRDGMIELSCNRETGEFTLAVRAPARSKKDVERAFTPVLVSADGTFQGGLTSAAEYLARHGLDPLSWPMGALHETAEMVLLAKQIAGLELYHPFARWFNDGVANWVLVKVVSEVAPELAEKARQACLPHADQPLRDEVNLFAWAQAVCEPPGPTADEEALSKAHYACATEAVDRMLADQPPDALAAILKKLKGRQRPDTAAICGVIREVTGKDAAAILLEYVPEDVRREVRLKRGRSDGMVSGKVLIAADARRQARDYAGMAATLSRAQQSNPSNLWICVNLAWALRKSGGPKREFDRQVRIALALMASDKTQEFEPRETDAETHYLFGRIVQLGGNKEAARKSFAEALKLDPNHADAKAALAELRR